eukprot:GFUD01023427.1.p1 GENE.GFUD01023427.1~~GFUD01023427.1.p1  ORF type:complete len:195 (+),score=75.96 GFUD01023427.1:91-675(+)
MTTQNDREVLNSILNPNLPLGEGLFDPEEKVPEDAPRKDDDDEIKDLESQAVKAAEAGDIKKALQLFDKVVSLAPDRPSSYNNRAQAFRLVGRPDSALKDLDKAIQLSEGKGRSGSAALCQRGVLHRKEGRDDDAITDFKAAAAEGSGFAKSMIVEMNPYAAMCNAMLKNVFTAMSDGKNTNQVMEENLKNKTG